MVPEKKNKNIVQGVWGMFGSLSESKKKSRVGNNLTQGCSNNNSCSRLAFDVIVFEVQCKKINIPI